jgi:hypothetical protein
MKKVILISVLVFSFFSCNKVKEKAKETINKGGEVVGQSATEFAEGVSEGIDKTLDCKIEIISDLLSKGLKTGKFTIETDSLSGLKNKAVVYFIFENDFKKSITIKVFDKTNLEMGRTTIALEGKKGDAKYYDIAFDKRTNIEVKSTIKIE